VEAGQQNLLSVSLRKGVLLATHRMLEEKLYQIKNRDQKAKTLLIEHPYRADWQMVEPATSTERTREVYRFTVPLDAGQTAALRVREEKQLQQTVQLVDSGSDAIIYYLHAKQVSANVKEALQRVVALRDRLSQTANRRNALEQRMKEIGQEQARIRDNMGRLAHTSELYNRYVKKLDQQETEMEKLRKEIDSLKGTEEEQRRELNDYLVSLDIG
jgi:nitrate reductase beta subunit